MSFIAFHVTLGCIALSSATEICHYKDKYSSKLNTITCEHGCCGDLEKQKCCNDLNWWMIFAFILVGLFIIFVVTVAIYLIVKQKNKKKEQVGTLQSNRGIDDQPNSVDLSIFQTENRGRRIDEPPAYTFDDPPSDSWRTNNYEEYSEHFAPDIYHQNQWQSRQGHTMPDIYHNHASLDRNESSWRYTDLSYFDKYLERSRNAGAQNSVQLPPLGRSRGHLEDDIPPKEAAEYEELRVSTQPDFTAEVTYRGQTSNPTAGHPVLERTDSSVFHYMARNDS